MTAFQNKPWNERFQAMGDEAENVFEHVAKQNNIGYTRYGLNRPPLNVSKLPDMLRYTPDYLTTTWGLVEVQGSGQDQIVKLKADKMRALYNWSEVYFVQMFLWDRHGQRWALEPIEQFNAEQADTAGFFDEKKPWYGFFLENFTWTDLT